MRHEGKPEAGRNHRDNPIVAVTAIHALNLRALARENVARKVRLLAINTVEVTFAVEVADADLVLVGEAVLPTEHDEELLPEERQMMQPLVDLVGPAINGGLQSAFEQALLKLGSARIRDL